MSQTNLSNTVTVSSLKGGSADDGETLETRRLPCRGCTRSCKNYDICDGKPWKLFDGKGVS